MGTWGWLYGDLWTCNSVWRITYIAWVWIMDNQEEVQNDKWKPKNNYRSNNGLGVITEELVPKSD